MAELVIIRVEEDQIVLRYVESNSDGELGLTLDMPKVIGKCRLLGAEVIATNIATLMADHEHKSCRLMIRNPSNVEESMMVSSNWSQCGTDDIGCTFENPKNTIIPNDGNLFFRTDETDTNASPTVDIWFWVWVRKVRD